MNREEKELSNRKRCLSCPRYGCNVCPFLAEADVFKIDKCILEYNAIKTIKEGTLDNFLFNDPKTSIQYLQYLGYKEKENYPKVGQVCITLTSGFSSYRPGKFVRVIKEDDIQFFLEDMYGVDKKQYCVEKSVWYKKLFKIEE